MSKEKHDLSNEAGFDTRAIHSGDEYNTETGAVIAPVYLTSTFAHGNPGNFDYTRSGNPNFRNLEKTLANLEGAKHATAFSSGVAAITAVVSTLSASDTIVAEENLYGCTYRLFEQVFRKFGVEAQYLDLTKDENIETLSSHNPSLIWIESPTNPLLKVLDIRKIAAKARDIDSPLIVDNTFSSPYLQRPLELGADLSLSSTTKYINGHSDSLGGVVCTNSSEWGEKMIFAQKALGLNPAPLDSWLTARGVKTLGLRMERHSENALALAQFFKGQTAVPAVHYPFLEGDAGYNIAKSQMKAGSGIISVDLGLSIDETTRFLKNLKFFTMAESLGGIESLVCHPASMTHASIPKEVREGVGLTDSLVRFSVGIEDLDDLIADIRAALPEKLLES
jgi:cystathionine gamma-synthase